jgi:hypothetical protein
LKEEESPRFEKVDEIFQNKKGGGYLDNLTKKKVGFNYNQAAKRSPANVA